LPQVYTEIRSARSAGCLIQMGISHSARFGMQSGIH
jgi:hypothetical protein